MLVDGAGDDVDGGGGGGGGGAKLAGLEVEDDKREEDFG